MITFEKHYPVQGDKHHPSGFTLILRSDDSLDEIELINFRKNKTPLRLVPEGEKQTVDAELIARIHGELNRILGVLDMYSQEIPPLDSLSGTEQGQVRIHSREWTK